MDPSAFVTITDPGCGELISSMNTCLNPRKCLEHKASHLVCHKPFFLGNPNPNFLAG